MLKFPCISPLYSLAKMMGSSKMHGHMTITSSMITYRLPHNGPDSENITHLTKVNCGPYIHGVRVRLGYSPNGGTIIVKTKAIRTKLAGKTI